MKYQDCKNALDSYFCNTEKNSLNTDYLEEQVELWVDNTSHLYYDIRKNSRRKIHSIIWEGFEQLARQCCEYIHRPFLGDSTSNYQPTSDQLKRYLQEYGYTPQSVFSNMCEHYEKVRAAYPNSI